MKLSAAVCGSVDLIRSGSRCNCPLDRSLESVELDRFDQVFGETRLQTFFDVTVIAEPADGNSRDFGNGVQLHHQFYAVPVWQCDIADEQIELIAHRGLHRGAYTVRCRHQVSPPDQEFFQGGAGVLMIIHEKNSQTLAEILTGSFSRAVQSFGR